MRKIDWKWERGGVFTPLPECYQVPIQVRSELPSYLLRGARSANHSGDTEGHCLPKCNDHAACVQYIGMRFMFVQLVFDRMKPKPNKQGNTEQKRDNSSKLKKSFLNVTYGVVGTTTRSPVGGLAKTGQNQPKSSLPGNTGQKIWPRTRLEVGKSEQVGRNGPGMVKTGFRRQIRAQFFDSCPSRGSKE